MSAPQPAWLKLWEQAGMTAVPAAALAIPTNNREHVGIIFLDDDGHPHLLHLASHYSLQCDDQIDGHAWVFPAIAPELLPSVAAMCARVVKRNAAGIPYGFRYDATRFTTDGQLTLGTAERGLTCATFVLAVLRSAGVELLARTEWPKRADDQVRFTRIHRSLTRLGADDAHLDAIEAEIDSVRFRPMEVAGASSEPPPCSFAKASAAATQMDAFLSTLAT